MLYENECEAILQPRWVREIYTAAVDSPFSGGCVPWKFEGRVNGEVVAKSQALSPRFSLDAIVRVRQSQCERIAILHFSM